MKIYLFLMVISSVFSIHHFVTGYEKVPQNYCIYCGDDFIPRDVCPGQFQGDWFRFKTAIKWYFSKKK